MKKLWAPWREKYIKRGNKQKENDRFLFTRLYRDKKKDKSNFIFARSQHAFAVLNIFPYNNGHVLIVPNRNVKDLDELEEKEREDLFYLLGDVKACLQETLKPQGFNIGINIGNKLSHTAHRSIDKSTRNDSIESSQIRTYIQRKTMHRNPSTAADTNGANLSFFSRYSGFYPHSCFTG